jgi:1-acyl-sn-glycerol-3-phosphate acyltransferase
MIQWLRSLLFVGQMYAMMPILAVFYTPWAIVDRRGAFAGIHAYTKWVRWSASWMVGLKTEVRGTPPTGEILIASKHQSFLDIIMIVSVVPRPKFIMKSSLKWAPILGWYGMRIGCVPVDRGKRAEAIRQMMNGVKNGTQTPGQLIIYPQGTRVAPGVAKSYKIGTAILYRKPVRPAFPAATNVGCVLAPNRHLQQARPCRGRVPAAHRTGSEPGRTSWRDWRRYRNGIRPFAGGGWVSCR